MTIYENGNTNQDLQMALLNMELRKPSVSLIRKVAGLQLPYERGLVVGRYSTGNPIFLEDRVSKDVKEVAILLTTLGGSAGFRTYLEMK